MLRKELEAEYAANIAESKRKINDEVKIDNAI